MTNWIQKIYFAAILASILFLNLTECKKNKQPTRKPNKNETSLFRFVWLVIYRVVTGFASWFGGQEAIADFMGGILVPPGVEESEDGDYRDHMDDDYRDYADYY